MKKTAIEKMKIAKEKIEIEKMKKIAIEKMKMAKEKLK